MKRLHPPHPHHCPHLPGPRIIELSRFMEPPIVAEMIKAIAVQHGIDPALLEGIKDQLEKVAALDELIAKRRQSIIAEATNSHANLPVFLAGEVPPPVTEEICCTISTEILQCHNGGPHGEIPPHIRSFQQRYSNFKCHQSIDSLLTTVFSAIVAHVYTDGEEFWGTNIAEFASKVWPDTKLLYFVAPHRAPHHAIKLSRDPNLTIKE